MTFCSASHRFELNSVPPASIKALPVTFREELREQASAERSRALPETAANYRPTFGIYQKCCCVSAAGITLGLLLFLRHSFSFVLVWSAIFKKILLRKIQVM